MVVITYTINTNQKEMLIKNYLSTIGRKHYVNTGVVAQAETEIPLICFDKLLHRKIRLPDFGCPALQR
jgi:hypothetical protein